MHRPTSRVSSCIVPINHASQTVKGRRVGINATSSTHNASQNDSEQRQKNDVRAKLTPPGSWRGPTPDTPTDSDSWIFHQIGCGRVCWLPAHLHPTHLCETRILTCSTHGQECVRSRMPNFTNHPLYYVAPSLANVPSFRVLSFLWALNWNTLPTNIWRGDSDRLGNKLLGQCPNHRWIRPLSSRAGSSLKVWNCAFFSLSMHKSFIHRTKFMHQLYCNLKSWFVVLSFVLLLIRNSAKQQGGHVSVWHCIMIIS